MGKQILAALVCIALTFTTWIIPVSAIAAAGTMGGFVENDGFRFTSGSGVLLMPFILSAIAAFCAFAGLFYLKSLYGTLIIGGVNALWVSLLLVFNVPIVPALAGFLASVAVAALLAAGIWFFLRWVYATESVPVDAEKEFA